MPANRENIMQYVIIGASAAGMQAAEDLRKLQPDCSIIVVSAENHIPYSRCLISRYLDGRVYGAGYSKDQPNMFFKGENVFEKLNVKAYLGKRVAKIDKVKRNVVLEDGTDIKYDKLLIATGARPVLPEVCSEHIDGIYTFHDLDDVKAIKVSAKTAKSAVVIGAGFAGLEAAYALAKLRLKTTVVERCEQILPNQLDQTASNIIKGDLEKTGISLLLDTSVAGIERVQPARNASRSEAGGGTGCRVSLSSGIKILADIVIVAAGIKPNTELADNAGLKVGNGIVVNEYLRTSDPDIYAAGDVIEIKDQVTGKRGNSATWFNAVLQGKYAAFNMAGMKRPYTGAVGIQNAVQFHELPAISYGKTKVDPDENGYEVMTWHKGDVYKKLVIKGSKLAGMIFVGDIQKSGLYAALIRNSVDISPYKEKLLDNDFSYGHFKFSYFKQEDFGQYDPYSSTAQCWDHPEWHSIRSVCMYSE